MRVCRLSENPAQTVLQCCSISGKGGVHHEISTAETVGISDLAHKVRNPLLFGKALINGDGSDVNQIAGFHSVLIHTKGSFRIRHQSHMNALAVKSSQRMVSDFAGATPASLKASYLRFPERQPCSVPIHCIRHICHAPLTVGMIQAAFGEAVITLRYRCRSWRISKGFPLVLGRA